MFKWLTQWLVKKPVEKQLPPRRETVYWSSNRNFFFPYDVEHWIGLGYNTKQATALVVMGMTMAADLNVTHTPLGVAKQPRKEVDRGNSAAIVGRSTTPERVSPKEFKSDTKSSDDDSTTSLATILAAESLLRDSSSVCGDDVGPTAPSEFNGAGGTFGGAGSSGSWDGGSDIGSSEPAQSAPEPAYSAPEPSYSAPDASPSIDSSSSFSDTSSSSDISSSSSDC